MRNRRVLAHTLLCGPIEVLFQMTIIENCVSKIIPVTVYSLGLMSFSDSECYYFENK